MTTFRDTPPLDADDLDEVDLLDDDTLAYLWDGGRDEDFLLDDDEDDDFEDEDDLDDEEEDDEDGDPVELDYDDDGGARWGADDVDDEDDLFGLY